jgi:hypothetical protein
VRHDALGWLRKAGSDLNAGRSGFSERGTFVVNASRVKCVLTSQDLCFVVVYYEPRLMEARRSSQ